METVYILSQRRALDSKPLCTFHCLQWLSVSSVSLCSSWLLHPVSWPFRSTDNVRRLLSFPLQSLIMLGGGTGYSGSTQCDSGSVCTVVNQCVSHKFRLLISFTDAPKGYHQCLPGTGGGPSTTVQPTTTPRPTTTSQPVTTIPTTASTTNTAPNTISTIPAGSLVTLSNFGSNPSNVGVQVYKPSSVKANPGLLVALHGCGGNGQVRTPPKNFDRQLTIFTL